jgi:hypothetical protein
MERFSEVYYGSAPKTTVEDRRELTQRDRSNLTHPQGYLMAASPVDIS